MGNKFLSHLPERLVFLITASLILIAPYIIQIPLSLGYFKTLKASIQEIFDSQESYVQVVIEGPVNQKGYVRFQENIDLQKIVKRAGGLKHGYTISPGKNLVFSSDSFISSNVSLDLTLFTEKIIKNEKKIFKKTYRENQQTFQKRFPYHDRINNGSQKEIGKKNGSRKPRYR